MSWVRPDHIPYPNVWDRFEGKIPNENGVINKYVIQDFTDDLTEAVINHMTKYFLIREMITSHDGFVEDAVSLRELHETWRKYLKQHSAMVAIVEGDGDLSSRLAGVNCLHVVEKSDKFEEKPHYKGRSMIRLIKAFRYFYSSKSVFETYHVDKYLDALGLSVAPQYQGDDVAYHLLKARTPFCQAAGIPLTATLFTHPAAAKVAVKDGFVIEKQGKSGDLIIDNHVFYPRLGADKPFNFTIKWIPGV